MHKKNPKICTGCRVSEAKIYLYHSTEIVKARPNSEEWQTDTSLQKQWSMPWLTYGRLWLFKIDFIFWFQDNYSPLHLGVEAGKSAGVECLLGHGAKVHIKGKSLTLVFMRIFIFFKCFDMNPSLLDFFHEFSLFMWGNWWDSATHFGTLCWKPILFVKKSKPYLDKRGVLKIY